jgi:hypothetical protein
MNQGEFTSLTALVRCREDTKFLENQIRTLLGSPLPSSVLRQLAGRVFSGDSEFILVPTRLVSSLRALMIERKGYLEPSEVLQHLCTARNSYRLQFSSVRFRSTGLSLDWPVLTTDTRTV